MVAARILEPDSKLATTRWWHTTTLPESLGVADANEDDLYASATSKGSLIDGGQLQLGLFDGVRLFWNGGFGMSHSGKGSSHLTRLRWRPLTGTTLPSA